MAESKIETPEIVIVEVEKPSRFQSFSVNHPRTAKVVGIAVVTGATLGAITMWKAREQELKNQLEENTEEVPFDVSSKTA